MSSDLRRNRPQTAHNSKKRKTIIEIVFRFILGRGGEIRTRDLQFPKLAR